MTSSTTNVDFDSPKKNSAKVESSTVNPQSPKEVNEYSTALIGEAYMALSSFEQIIIDFRNKTIRNKTNSDENFEIEKLIDSLQSAINIKK